MYYGDISIHISTSFPLEYCFKLCGYLNTLFLSMISSCTLNLFLFLPYNSDMLFFLWFLQLASLAPRQEPVLDSSKYTAADVRIVSPSPPILLIFMASNLHVMLEDSLIFFFAICMISTVVLICLWPLSYFSLTVVKLIYISEFVYRTHLKKFKILAGKLQIFLWPIFWKQIRFNKGCTWSKSCMNPKVVVFMFLVS